MIKESVLFKDVLKVTLIVLAGLIVLLYVMFQARFLIVGPQIRLSSELPPQHNQRIITLSGNATNISRLWLNGRQIFTNPQGAFSAAVVLENGYTIAKLEAEDRYGRRTALTREFVYAPMNFTTSH